MKKVYSTILVLATMVAALSLTNCSSNSDDEEDDKSIVGIWKIITVDSNLQEASSLIGDVWYFNSDGSFKEPTVNGHWTLSGNTLTIVPNEGETAVFSLIRLTDKELALQIINRDYSITLYFKRILDDDGNYTDSTSSFSITYDGERNDVEDVEWLNPHFGNGGYNKGNYFCLESYPLGNGQIHIIFPYSLYGKNVQPSYFQVGYSDFGEDATDIEYITTSMAGWHGEYVSGSAKVVKNSGSSITLQFTCYKFEVSRSGKTHEFILNGTLEFENYMYD